MNPLWSMSAGSVRKVGTATRRQLRSIAKPSVNCSQKLPGFMFKKITVFIKLGFLAESSHQKF